MARRCSHCNNNGHNSRTCPSRNGGGIATAAVTATAASPTFSAAGGGGVKLFGVRLIEAPLMKKSASMGNLLHYHLSSSSTSSASPNPNSPSSDTLHEPANLPDGYLSDDPVHAACSSNRRADRKKGVPWTEEEHRLFLIGLGKLGKGDWRGIARNFVMSRTPTQVASHAQKYFIRQSNASRRKRRSSLFDMIPEMARSGPSMTEAYDQSHKEDEGEDDAANSLPSLGLIMNATESMDTAYETHGLEVREGASPTSQLPLMVPALFPTYIPVSVPIWVPNTAANSGRNHEVLRPTPVLRNQPLNIDELVGLSQLSLTEAENGSPHPSFTSAKSLCAPSRPSAFHVRSAPDESHAKSNGSPIQAV